jgi:hypothetical protein
MSIRMRRFVTTKSRCCVLDCCRCDCWTLALLSSAL